MILVIDNFDSFTYNLVQYLGQCGAEVMVRRNNQIDLGEIKALAPSGIMLSPGPCTPDHAGVCLDVLRSALAGEFDSTPIFGVCLGHQSMAYVGGGVVRQARNIMHGKASMVKHDGMGLFQGMPNPFRAIRYHSLIVPKENIPSGFVVTAHALDDNEVMGLRHERLPIEGVQFHPESVLTEEGIRIVQNFVNRVRSAVPK